LVEHRGRYGMPDVRMMMSRNYCSKVELCRRYRLPDVRMMMSKNYYSKVDNEVLCKYC
jgi:hypothetical protein